jgi:hypothetical protein
MLLLKCGWLLVCLGTSTPDASNIAVATVEKWAGSCFNDPSVFAVATACLVDCSDPDLKPTRQDLRDCPGRYRHQQPNVQGWKCDVKLPRVDWNTGRGSHFTFLQAGSPPHGIRNLGNRGNQRSHLRRPSLSGAGYVARL